MAITYRLPAPPPAPAPAVRTPSARPSRPAAEPSRRRRLAGADAVRALAALAVIVVHAGHWPLQDTGADHAVWNGTTLLARFCVPAFVVLTGLLLAHTDGARDRGAFLRRRFSRSLLPWLVWAPVYLVAGLAYSGDVAGSGGPLAWLAGGTGHLYYLLLVPQFYLVYLVWPKSVRATAWLAAVCLPLQAVLGWLRLEGWLPGGAESLALSNGFELFPFWIGFFAVGVAAGRALRGSDADRPRLALLLGALAVPAAALLLIADTSALPHGDYAVGTGSFLRPTLIPLVLAVVGAALFGAPALMRAHPLLRRTVSVVGRHSLGIYILHPLLMTQPGRWLTPPLLHQHLPVSIVGAVLLYAAALLLAMGATRLLVATPLAVTLGEPRQPLRLRREREPGAELRGRRAGEREAA